VSQADDIRAFVKANYIDKAEREGLSETKVRAGTVEREMGLTNAVNAVIGALAAAVFREQARVDETNRTGPPVAGTNTEFTFRLRARPSVANPSNKFNRGSLEKLKADFLAHYKDFARLGFQADHGGYWDQERAYKQEVMARADALVADQTASDEAVGQGMVNLLQQPPANFVGWRAFAHIRFKGPVVQSQVSVALGEMLRNPDDATTIAATCAAKLSPLLHDSATDNSAQGLIRSLVTTALALTRPGDAVAVKTRYLQRAAKLLTGRGVFKTGVMTADEYRELLALADWIFAVMRDDWGWAPKDLWDVQGFLWVTSELYEPDAQNEDEETVVTEEPKAMVEPTNLILYGPPGTGKTYRTAERAVLLCDERAHQLCDLPPVLCLRRFRRGIAA
jgi:hypothetical protein